MSTLPPPLMPILSLLLMWQLADSGCPFSTL